MRGAISPDGGRILRKFTRQPDGNYSIEVLEATGKYTGIVLTGTAKSFGPFPSPKSDTGVFCNRQSGTYKFK